MSSLQAVHNIPEICAQHGITDVVLSPGSRSAPLTLAFARHPAYQGKLRVVPDERAAAFIALGIAQATRRPVVLVCTSGTAGLNYAPAVAEAFFQQIPLLILTADRPPEWIDQLDGQTIRQRNLYGAHAKGAFDFPPDTSHPDAKWHAGRIINEAINLTQAAPAGPVQVNIPLREPFYPKEEIEYEQDVKIIRDDELGGTRSHTSLDLGVYQLLKPEMRILVVMGQQPANAKLTAAVAKFAAVFGAPVVSDVIGNLTGMVPLRENASEVGSAYFPAVSSLLPAPAEQFITHQDVFLAGLSAADKNALQPDLLITCGQSLISKSLKLFLRTAKPKEHWHIQASGPVADTFGSLTQVVRCAPADFFARWESAELPVREILQPWQQAETTATAFLAAFFTADDQPFNEFSAFHQVLSTLLNRTALHLANSMAVRYANILGIPQGRQIEVFANRGTSGIDGCTSTAVGAALAQPAQPVVLLTGDVAFFYDRNAFWHNYPTPNLRVVLFNNHGGGIFRLIDGPRQQPELEEFFETRQTLTAENTARDFGLRYFPVATFTELEAALPVFLAAEGGAAILEIFTDSKTNAAFFEQYRTAVKLAFA
ncbi:2-succinyl-5-enolpyruvyl-6-hydroxy-3-cyclohexene-1-carboxylic-acid synthase [Hymenobacter amundsenii]|uniref:2-succinyl-5-enolpyruvyl-6-hydroxy-3-cyclohexene-1-carboxylate synthase n=1 Tax=Hymenobacter amundsenii TaxID=2006685 RepID=A0A246FNC6_9BACT|nr:2-succinyl-5-enolpyruvyl-6-hydroxy-3-cyclohexene-1-carboxylic-acid synthase [Hymenobacter amundsenii]OWP64238.1 2-succinyl-5-enolpyruvyl-6-hydroxy-3-cyclohexene-1-carboxylic-acid synthase [Hymenobacter amundsenii]